MGFVSVPHAECVPCSTEKMPRTVLPARRLGFARPYNIPVMIPAPVVIVIAMSFVPTVLPCPIM
jgi:hypothetical protein